MSEAEQSQSWQERTGGASGREGEKRLVIFDLSRTLFDTFKAGNTVAMSYWNDEIRSRLEKIPALKGMDTLLTQEDLTQEDYCEAFKPKRLFCHKIYKSLHGLREYQRKRENGEEISETQQADFERHGNRLAEVYVELLDKKLEEFKQSLKGDNSSQAAEKIAAAEQAMKRFQQEFFGERGKVILTEGKKEFTYPTFGNAQVILEATYGDGESLKREFYYADMLKIAADLAKEGHVIAVATRNKRSNPDDPRTVFRSDSDLLSPQYGIVPKGKTPLIFTREDGDKKLHDDEGKGLPKLVESIRKRAQERDDVTEEMLQNPVVIDDMPHGGMLAARMGGDWIQAIHGQDKEFLKKDSTVAAIQKARDAVVESGGNYRRARDVERLREVLTDELRLLREEPRSYQSSPLVRVNQKRAPLSENQGR